MKKYFKYLMVIAVVAMFAGGGKVQAQSMKIVTPSKTMYVKQKVRMQITPSSMKGKVKWKSSDKKIASVAKNGTVTARKAGKVKIYAISLKNSKKKAVCRITVKPFRNRTLSVNCYAEKFSSQLPSIGKKYRVFDSKKEIDEYLKADKKNGGYVSYGMESVMKQYKKSFFKNKSLCVVYISTFGSGSTPVSMEKSIQLTQNKNGKVTAKLRAGIGVQGPDEMWTCDVVSAYAVIELSKKDAAMIQDYKVETFMMDPEPIIDY